MEKNSGIEVSIDDFSYINNGGKNPTEYNYKNIKAFIGLDSDGNLFSYGNVEASWKDINTGKSSSKVYTGKAQFVLKDYKIYYYESSDNDNEEEEYGIVDVFEELEDIFYYEFDIEVDAEIIAQTLSTIISKLPNFIENDVSEFNDKISNAIKTELNDINARVLSNIFDLSEVDGNYVLTKKSNLFTDFANDFESLTAINLIKKYFGSDVSTFITNIPELLNKNIGDVVSYLNANNQTPLNQVKRL